MPSFTVEGCCIGRNAPCYIIAEAGVAHFGCLDKALSLVDLAADAGANAVKFQIFDSESLISIASPQWRERMKDRQLPYEAFRIIQEYAKEKSITFFATPHDLPSLEALSQLDPPMYKIGSGEVGNWDFISEISTRGRPVILSTGMYDEADVMRALEVIANTGNRELAVLHCVTAYPAPFETISLRSMIALERLGVIAGYSDHTTGYAIPLAAVALGARIIEKHIALDFEVPNAQDWKVSLDRKGLTDFIYHVRSIESALGLDVKKRSFIEDESALWARKSLVTTKPMAKGEKLNKLCLIAKRPGGGIPPWECKQLIGRITQRALPADHRLSWNDLL